MALENNQEYINLLNEIELNYLNKNRENRSFRNFLLNVIVICAKNVYDIKDNILDFVIYCITYYDEQVSRNAEYLLFAVLKRKQKFTNERIDVKKYPTISSMPNILDKITVKYPQNGYYFPSSSSSSSSSNSIAEKDESNSLSADHSIDINPTKSIDVNIENTDVNEDVIKVFDSFKKIEIEWKMNDEDHLLFDSEFMTNKNNGFLMFKDHFNHKKYEFSSNEMLLKNIPNIFSSQINSINEKSLSSKVNYKLIWSYYALTVGPHCTKILSKISRKYLSEYFDKIPELTSKILCSMITGFLEKICYWSIEQRIEFFKLVSLPIFCVVLTSPNSVEFAQKKEIVKDFCNKVNPFIFAPMIKIIFDLSKNGPNDPIYNSYILRCLGHLFYNRQFFLFNSIDQIKAKFIDPFICQMDEYKMTTVKEVSFLIFNMLNCCSLIPKKSPLYSQEIETKTIEIGSIFDTILNKESSNDSLIQFMTKSFDMFQSSLFDSRLIASSIFIRNLHKIFILLKSSRISNEKSFVESFAKFIENDIFLLDQSLRLDFLSSLIPELLNSPLPLQMILLESVNKMLKNCIFRINMSDYNKYEDIFLKYAKEANFGNELKMKITKVLGIFEIRSFSLKKSDVDLEKVDDIDYIVLKAASVILNAYLFDRIDEKVMQSLEIMEKICEKCSEKSNYFVFFKIVLEIFIHRHSGNVIGEVDEVLNHYKCMMAPSYIS